MAGFQALTTRQETLFVLAELAHYKQEVMLGRGDLDFIREYHLQP